MSFESATLEFEQWLNNSNYQISSKVKIHDYRNEGQGRGLIAVQDIQEDEILFQIPRNAILNIETGTLSSINLENKEKLLTKYNHWDGLYLTILYELSLGEKSRWAPYFKVLPEYFQTLMYWTDEELQMLSPSLVVSRIGKSKAKETYDSLIPNALIDLGISTNLNDLTSIDKFHQIASTIMSYSFDVERTDFDEDKEDDELVQNEGYFKSMVGLADILNANTTLANANLFYETEFLIMKSVKSIPKGEQIYNTYGDHPNSELLRRYGYVEWEGSKYDFGEVTIENIKTTIIDSFSISVDQLDELLDLISQNDVEEIEEDIILEAYDFYQDGEVLPEFQILIQVLTILLQINQSENLFTGGNNDSSLQKLVNRTLKKCYQLIESGSITKKSIGLIDSIIKARLSEYPSHSFRKLEPENLKLPDDYSNKNKLSERVLKSEVQSLQKCLSEVTKSFKIIDDDKLIRNIMKRKASNDLRADTKRQKI